MAAELQFTPYFCPDIETAQSWAEFITPVDELRCGREYTLVLARQYNEPADLLRAIGVCEMARFEHRTPTALVFTFVQDVVSADEISRVPGACVVGNTIVLPRFAPMLFFDLSSF